MLDRHYPLLLATSPGKRYIVRSTVHRVLPAAFAQAMARAEHDKERVVVTRDGWPAAALVPIEDVEALEAIEDAHDSRLAAEAMAQWEAEGRPPGIPLEEIVRTLGIDLAADPSDATSFRHFSPLSTIFIGDR